MKTRQFATILSVGLCSSLPFVGSAMTKGNGAFSTQVIPTTSVLPAGRILDLQSVAAKMAPLGPGGRSRSSIPLGTRSAKGFAQKRAQTQSFNRPTVTITSDLSRGVVEVRPNVGRGVRSLAKASAAQPPDATLRGFVDANLDIFGFSNATDDLQLSRTEFDQSGGAHFFYDQYLNGIPFWGRQVAGHFDKNGNLEAITCFITTDMTTVKSARRSPQLSPAQAILAAQKQLAANGVTYTPPTDKMAKAMAYAGPTASLHFWQIAPGMKTNLVYVVEDRPNIVDWFRFFVDAETGSILEYYNNTQTDGPATANATNLLNQTKSIKTYQVGSTYYMIDTSRPMFQTGQSSSQITNEPKGALVTLDLRNEEISSDTQIFHFTSSGNSWSDKTSVSAHDLGSVAYEYFRQSHGRNSLDGKGGTIYSIVHLGQNTDNAYWNGSAMLYGDGGSQFLPLARGLDVAAHEMTHGVTQNSANLEYKNQSGALNESFSDVFGIIVDSNDYLLGEDVVRTTTYPSGALRNLQNPHNGGNSIEDNGWQPANMGEFVQLPLSQDNGGVHVNSGIPNHAAYYIIDAIGRTKAAAIYYRALTTTLLKQANFADCRKALEDAAIAIYGNNSTEHNAVKNGYANVGIGNGGTSTPPPDDPVPSGNTKAIAMTNTRQIIYLPGGPNDGANAQFLSAVTANSYAGANYDIGTGKPFSVDPVSGFVYWVGADFKLYAAEPGGATLNVGTNPIYNSIAFSPSGRKLAVTLSSSPGVKNNSVFVIDFGVFPSTVVEYKLFHPTSAANLYDDIVERPDTIDWIDEDLVIFDCFNVQGTGEATNAYWDISILDTQSVPASPNIYPLLASQPAGIQVGNPVVSSRNGAILCFDYLIPDVPDGGHIYSANLYTGVVNSDFVNLNSNEIGVCDYSPDDSTFYLSIGSSLNVSSNYSCYFAPLATDRLSFTANFNGLYNDAGYFNAYSLKPSSVSPSNLVDYLLRKTGAAPEVVDFNSDGKSDASDIKSLENL